MAGRLCGVRVSFLCFSVIFLLNASLAHISDAESSRYLAYEGDARSSEDLVFKPLVRLRRDDTANEEKNGEKPTDMGKKATVPTKNPKPAKGTTKNNLLLKKMTPADSPSVETPSSVTTSSNATSYSTSATTTTITTRTTSSTTTSSPTTISSVPISTSTSADASPPKDESVSKNSTGGAMPTETEAESTTAPEIPKNGTETEVAKTEVPIKSIDEVNLEDNDPDSGDDIVPALQGYNTENTTVDHHRFYKSMMIKGDDQVQQYWVDFDNFNKEKVVVNEMLSDSHRRAATVPLTFDFPFYGHMLRNITIATGGFLFTGDFVHTWLAATQYIAPLMANFDTSVSKDACVKYADNGTSFTVQWDNVKLKDHMDAGTFTFQATLHRSGDITFTYKTIPVVVTNIGDDQHPVKVGLSDAYIVDRTIFYVRRKTIYEYHKIDMKKSSLIGNWTAILFTALPTCMPLNNCEACLSTKISFQCTWCNKIGRCSTGLDRHRQDWLYNGCEAHSVQDFDKCAGLAPPPTSPSNISPSGNSSINTFGKDASAESYKNDPGTQVLDASEYEEGIVTDGEPDTLAHTSGRDAAEGSGVGGVVAVIFILGLVLGVVGWVAYAYFYPHSTSGQLLIKYRPSTWAWRRGEARYTAAAIHSIHM